MASIDYKIGSLEARIVTLERQVITNTEKLDEILAFVSSAKGSWKALVAMGALASLITGGVMKIIELLVRA